MIHKTCAQDLIDIISVIIMYVTVLNLQLLVCVFSGKHISFKGMFVTKWVFGKLKFVLEVDI